MKAVDSSGGNPSIGSTSSHETVYSFSAVYKNEKSGNISEASKGRMSESCSSFLQRSITQLYSFNDMYQYGRIKNI